MRKIVKFLARLGASCAAGATGAIILSKYKGPAIFKILAFIGFGFIGARVAELAAEDADEIVDATKDVIEELKEN